MTNYNSRTVNEGTILVCLFCDPFDSLGSPDPEKWNVESGKVEVSNVIGHYSLSLSSSNSMEGIVRSVQMNLTNYNSGKIHLDYIKTDLAGDEPDVLDNLVIEIQTADNNFIQVGEIFGSAASMTSFGSFSVPLPPSSFHHSFSFRIRNKANPIEDGKDVWVVDNVCLEVHLDNDAALAEQQLELEEELQEVDNPSDKIQFDENGDPVASS